MRARLASAWDTVRPRAQRPSVSSYSDVSSKGSTGLPTRRFISVMTVGRVTHGWIQIVEEFMDSGH